MDIRRMISLLLAMFCVLTVLTGCTDQKNAAESPHQAITMQSPFRDVSMFLDVLEEKYPEINLEIIPYSGANTTAYLSAELKAGDMPDIYVASVYYPGSMDLSDRLLDLSGYDFTNNYAESHLRDLSDNGALYLLPTNFTCFGITYNKTLLEQNGWELPTTFAELEALAPKVKAAGYNLAVNQIALPGYGFQYLCNILDTCFLNTLEGRRWQRDFLGGSATVKDSPQMTEALATLEKWKELGMLNGDGSWTSDGDTKAIMAEGNTLFMLGSINTFTAEETDCEFGLIPYLSEDGTQNALILNVSRYIGLNKHLQDKGNEQKLQDALHVMEVISTVEGMTAINKGLGVNTLLPLQDYEIAEDSYYKQVESELNAGLTAPFIYAGWDNLIVPIGNTVLDYIKGNATIADIAAAFDDNRSLLADNSAIVYTTVTEKLDTDDCARLVGICFGKACGADLALISKNKWYRTQSSEIVDLNTQGVSGALFALPVTDQEITSILPTGWRGSIKTVTLTGARIKQLAETGYDRDGLLYPYELVAPEGMVIEDSATYTAVICGVSDEVAAEGQLTDTGISGLEAAQRYFSQFKTLSKKDIIWE